MSVFYTAYTRHQPVGHRYCRMIISAMRKRVTESPNFVSKNGEHVTQLAPKMFLTYLAKDFQTPGVYPPQNLTNHKGERRLLIGFTDTGLMVESRRILTSIPPFSMYTIVFPKGDLRRFSVHGPADPPPTNGLGSAHMSLLMGTAPSPLPYPTDECSTGFRTW